MTRQMLHEEEGSQLVETAISLSILLTLLLGIMQLCLGMYYYNYVGEAAREATRFAIVRGPGCSGLSGGCPASQADITTYVINNAYPGIDTSKLTVNSTLPANCPGGCVSVQVQYQANLPIPFTPGLNLTLSSTSSELVSQ